MLTTEEETMFEIIKELFLDRLNYKKKDILESFSKDIAKIAVEIIDHKLCMNEVLEKFNKLIIHYEKVYNKNKDDYRDFLEYAYIMKKYLQKLHARVASTYHPPYII